ncbi:hypothetical protein [Haloactinospora alba]|uniref:hypothetical protein n=1 Tax=Haloactinospora alba TaxID=405555 RepID=UPI0011511212|nr:hypothetical protein [Haloactinospora alba]
MGNTLIYAETKIWKIFSRTVVVVGVVFAGVAATGEMWWTSFAFLAPLVPVLSIEVTHRARGGKRKQARELSEGERHTLKKIVIIVALLSVLGLAIGFIIGGQLS